MTHRMKRSIAILGAPSSISHTGGAAGMDLALAVGRGGALSRLGGETPLLREDNVVVLARKDEADEPYYGPHSLRRSAVHDLPWEFIRQQGAAAAAASALERLTRPELKGFWIHVDVDVRSTTRSWTRTDAAPRGWLD